MACGEENLPPGLYDYQIERLLSAGESKVWMQIVNSEDCEDSLRLLVERASDSIDIYRLIPGELCDYQDTSFVGRAEASNLPDGLLFTDSLNFSDGDFWLVESITSKSLTLTINAERISYAAE